MNVFSIYHFDQDNIGIICNNSEIIYEAISSIDEAWFFPDRVMIMYNPGRFYPYTGGSPEKRHILTDEEIKLIGQNVLMIDSKGEIIWEIDPTRPDRRLYDRFHYYNIRQEKNGKWTVEYCDKYIFELDIETGKLSKWDPAEHAL